MPETNRVCNFQRIFLLEKFSYYPHFVVRLTVSMSVCLYIYVMNSLIQITSIFGVYLKHKYYFFDYNTFKKWSAVFWLNHSLRRIMQSRLRVLIYIGPQRSIYSSQFILKYNSLIANWRVHLATKWTMTMFIILIVLVGIDQFIAQFVAKIYQQCFSLYLWFIQT